MSNYESKCIVWMVPVSLSCAVMWRRHNELPETSSMLAGRQGAQGEATPNTVQTASKAGLAPAAAVHRARATVERMGSTVVTT